MAVHLYKSLKPSLARLERDLRGCGPAAMLLLGAVHNARHRLLPYEFHVDSEANFKAGLARLSLRAERGRIDEHYTMYARHPDALRELLTAEDFINWEKRLCFKPVPSSCVGVLQEASAGRGTWQHYFPEPYLCYVSTSPVWSPLVHPVPGYSVGSLQEWQSARIASEWGYGDEGTGDYFASLIRRGGEDISAAVYEAEEVGGEEGSISSSDAHACNNGPVPHDNIARHSNDLAQHSNDLAQHSNDLAQHSNDLAQHSNDLAPRSNDIAPHTNDRSDLAPRNNDDLAPHSTNIGPYMSIELDGNLDYNNNYNNNISPSRHAVAYGLVDTENQIIHCFVSPSHRHKRLGSLMLTELTRKVHAQGMPAIAFIAPDNVISQRMFTRCGFARQPGEYHWLEFVPHSQKP